MRALWLIRANLEQHPGGDTTQVLSTALALRAREVEVILSSDPEPNLDGFDIVHLFHLDRAWENGRWWQQIRAKRMPSVLSPIYWPSDEFDRQGRTGVQGLMSRLASGVPYQNIRIAQRSALPLVADGDFRTVNWRMFSFERSVRYALNTADVILPNSRAEQAQLERRFGVQSRCLIVPNAVDPRVYPAADGGGRRPGEILSVGRIEPRKNQLALIRAVRDTPFTLVLVGQPGRFSQRYARLCRRAAGPNVQFLDWRSSSDLRELYHSAELHASVSWYETPGLASLEAAACGCRIVVTPGGCTREYFGNHAEYCSPANIGSIRQALFRAMTRPHNGDLARTVEAQFNWNTTAQRTLEAYDLALKGDSSRPAEAPYDANACGALNGPARSCREHSNLHEAVSSHLDRSPAGGGRLRS